MPGKPYDLQALTYEIQQSLLDARTDAQDLTRAADLVLDRLGCDTAA